MPEVAAPVVNEKEAYKKKIMRCMDSWRELALVAKTVLLWDKPSYPWILIISTSLLFLEISYLDPNLMTAMCMVGLVLVVIDFTVPMVCDSFWKQENWTASKQKEFETIGWALSVTCYVFVRRWKMLVQLKQEKPPKYYLITIGGLLVMAWIGSVLNNLFLTYLFVLGVLMAPGLIHHGYADQAYKIMFGTILKLVRPKTQ